MAKAQDRIQEAAPPRERFSVPKTVARRVKVVDRAAGVLIRVFGILVIAVVALIFVFIVREIVPLFAPASSEVRLQASVAPVAGGRAVLAAGLDEFESFPYVVRADGSVEFRPISSWDEPIRVSLDLLAGRELTATYRSPSRDLLFLGTDDGHVLVAQAVFDASFDPVTSARTVTPSVEQLALVELPVKGPVRRLFGRGTRGRDVVFVAEGGEGKLATANVEGRAFARARASGGLLPLPKDADGPYVVRILPAALDGPVKAFAVDGEGNRLFVATETGALHQWYLHETHEAPFATYPAPGRMAGELGLAPVSSPSRRISALEMLIGDSSLLVGYDDGSVESWVGVRLAPADRLKRVRPVHAFDRLPGAVTALQPSGRDKSFLALAADGTVHLDYLTTERTLLGFRGPAGATAVAYAPKLTGLLVAGPGGEIEVRSVDNPHPEVSLRTLFGKVWYEGYDAPGYTWQSSSGSDEFEPKLSLVPLGLGTLKGAFYGLLFAVPIAVFGALYASQFMSPRLRSLVKPTIEIMAALPSVVIGFLAGLWLAPALENKLTVLVLAAFLVPGAAVAAAALWRLVPRRIRRRIPDGQEVFVLVPLAVGAFASGLWLAPHVDAALFGGDVRQWLYDTLGAKVEQRNSIVVGLAMGFAVIPLIFTISEDAFSNVPRSFTSASLALGASRWQTAIRVVAPTASPGVFSAIMIGFGRAVGETMIVLMATGNTPILSFSPFNGMRTLSANIAVEIPEAPFGETHYRTLFLAALLLFLLTFVVNTAAEVVRQRLRDKYQAV
jgi:phosphate transport system permease protein